MIKPIKNWLKTNAKTRRFWALIALTKVPFLIYLVVTLSMVPAIEAVGPNYIQGAHRGASIDYEENTLEAFEKAVNEPKYDFIEFDVQYTKDKEIAVFHQTVKYGIPKKLIEISNLTYEELDEKFEFHVPNYSEAMEIIAGKKPVEIEIKSHGNEQEDFELVDFIIKDCKKRKICKEILISSPSEHIVKYLKENYPEIKTGRVYWVVPSTFIESEYLTEALYNGTEADYLLMHGYNINNYELLSKLKPVNKTLVFWYFTDEIYIVGDKEEQEVRGFWDNR